MMHGAYDVDVTPLRNALARLQKSLAYCGSDLAANDPDIAEQFRAAAIQAFEFTYELSHKILRRKLEALSASPVLVHIYSFAELIKAGQEANLLSSDWGTWSEYRRARSITSHTYNEESADRVFAILPRFVADARDLIERLEQSDPA